MAEGPRELVWGWQGMGHFEAAALHYGYIAYLSPQNVKKCMAPRPQ